MARMTELEAVKGAAVLMRGRNWAEAPVWEAVADWLDYEASRVDEYGDELHAHAIRVANGYFEYLANLFETADPAPSEVVHWDPPNRSNQ